MSTLKGFSSIHCHSMFSVRDGICKPQQLVARAIELGYNALCISEHGNLSSVWKFYKECKKQGIKYVPAIEFYYCDDVADKGSVYHLMAYAKNNNGYTNLCKLSSEAYINYFYKKPRIDFNLLSKHKDDIIISTACLASKPAQLIMNEEYDKANEEIDRLHKLFGDDFYLEVHDHGIPEEELVRDHYRTYGRDNNIKIVAGTDTHYVLKEDKEIHNIFKQIAYNSVGNSDDDAFPGSGYYLWSYEEFQEKFNQDEIDNTVELTDKCNVEFNFDGYRLPEFKLPVDDKDTYEYIRELCYNSLKAKGLIENKTYIDRLEYELNMLHLADLENYLLIVSDYMSWCKKNNIYTSPGRGSMAGSIVSWLLQITEVDPLKYDLLFSRAVNVGRCLILDFGV